MTRRPPHSHDSESRRFAETDRQSLTESLLSLLLTILISRGTFNCTSIAVTATHVPPFYIRVREKYYRNNLLHKWRGDFAIIRWVAWIFFNIRNKQFQARFKTSFWRDFSFIFYFNFSPYIFTITIDSCANNSVNLPLFYFILNDFLQLTAIEIKETYLFRVPTFFSLLSISRSRRNCFYLNYSFQQNAPNLLIIAEFLQTFVSENPTRSHPQSPFVQYLSVGISGICLTHLV